MSPSERRGAPESPEEPSGGPWLTREDVAALLRCHVNHVDALRAMGMPHVRLGRAVRIHREALDEWLRGLTVTAGGGSDVSGATGVPCSCSCRCRWSTKVGRLCRQCHGGSHRVPEVNL